MKHNIISDQFDTPSDEYLKKQASLFRKEFESEIAKKTAIEDTFLSDLKHVQRLVFDGKLNPIHKQILLEWQTLYPDRFENFCLKMTDENRQKLYHFLQFDPEDAEF